MPGRSNITSRRMWFVLSCFFCRAVNPGIGKLLIKRGIHVGLWKQEWFRDTGFLSPATARGRNSQTRVSLTCFNSNTRYPGARSSGLSPHVVFDSFLPEMDPLPSALKTLPCYTPRSLGHSFLSLWDISGGTTVSQSPFPHFSGLITTRVTFPNLDLSFQPQISIANYLLDLFTEFLTLPPGTCR